MQSQCYVCLESGSDFKGYPLCEKHTRQVDTIINSNGYYKPVLFAIKRVKSRHIKSVGKHALVVRSKREYYRGEYLKSDHWKQLRAAKLARHPACERCGKAEHVEPHHLRYKQLYDVTIWDLVTLCRGCHNREHERLDAEKRNRHWRPKKRWNEGPYRRAPKYPLLDALQRRYRKSPPEGNGRGKA